MFSSAVHGARLAGRNPEWEDRSHPRELRRGAAVTPRLAPPVRQFDVERHVVTGTEAGSDIVSLPPCNVSLVWCSVQLYYVGVCLGSDLVETSTAASWSQNNFTPNSVSKHELKISGKLYFYLF